jgi:hypothetical protein
LATSAFIQLAHLQARAMGFPDLRIITIEHPLGGIDPEEVLKKVPDAASSVGSLMGAD